MRAVFLKVWEKVLTRFGVGRHYVVWVPLPLFHPALCTPRPTNLLDLPPSPSQSGTSTPSGSSRTNPLAKPFAPPLPHEPSICSSLSPSVSRVGRASVAPTKGSWDFVCRNGLGGLTGRAEEWWRVRRREKERQRGVQDDGGMGAGENDQQGARRSEEYDEKQGPEKEIRAFVLKKWRVEDGWETAWCVFARRSSLVMTLYAAECGLTILARPCHAQVRQPTRPSKRPRPGALPRPRTKTSRHERHIRVELLALHLSHLLAREVDLVVERGVRSVLLDHSLSLPAVLCFLELLSVPD